jgi:hypothetical protein
MAQLPSDEHITYQLHYRQCGKPSCRTCRIGPGHGPYWYAYWHKGSQLRSVFIGKVRPASRDTPRGSSAPESTTETVLGGAVEEPHPGEGTSRE